MHAGCEDLESFQKLELNNLYNARVEAQDGLISSCALSSKRQAMKLSNYNYIFLIKKKNSHIAYAYQQSIRELILTLQLRMKTLENTSIIFGFIFLFGNGN